MAANQNALLNYIGTILTPAQKVMIADWSITGGGFAGVSGITPQALGRKTTARKASPAARIRTRSNTAANALTGRAKELWRYLEQHPTASLTAPQLAEVSPFKNWKPASITRICNGLTKKGLLAGNGTVGWSPINRAMTQAKAA